MFKKHFRKYAAVVFVAVNRFETNKRKLQYLNFSDFYHCAHQVFFYKFIFCVVYNLRKTCSSR